MKNIVTGDVPLAHAGGRSTVTMSPISGHRHTEHVSERIGMALTYDNDLRQAANVLKQMEDFVT